MTIIIVVVFARIETITAVAGRHFALFAGRLWQPQRVRQRVTSQVAIASEDLPASITVIRFDVGVCQKMSLQVAPLVEGSATGGTLVRTVLHVQDSVHSQRTGLAEAFSALPAFEWFFFRVYVSERNKKKCKRNSVCGLLLNY